MPIQNNNFNRYTNTTGARRAVLLTVGAAVQEAAQQVEYDRAGVGVVTGNLRRSHVFTVDGDHVDVGVTADYGAHVHNGTTKRNGRPWLKNALQNNRQQLLELATETYRREVDR